MQHLAALMGLLGLMLFLSPVALAQNNDEAEPSTLLPPDTQLFLPQIRQGQLILARDQCPQSSSANYGTVSTLGTLDRPAEQNPDLNLALRGYQSIDAPLRLVDIDGHTDNEAPQLAAIFADRRAPSFTAAYRVHEWDWTCTADGCKGSLISHPSVTLVALQSKPQESIHIPARAQQIDNGGYSALVLYAEETRLTLTYTRDNSPARGYVVHLEDFCVDPNLLALYRQLNGEGRSRLPAILPQDVVGQAANLPLKVAVRDEGSFLDPRSRKDWWAGY